MNKKGVLLVVAFFLVILLIKPFTVNLKTISLILDVFPGSPIKPLTLFTRQPIHKKTVIQSKNGPIVADLYFPQRKGEKPALILATGVKIAFQDRPYTYKVLQSYSRLGFITIWPRLKPLDKGVNLPEEPETEVETFEYLEKLPDVDKNRISIIGGSSGSSVGMIAAEDPRINSKIHSFVFFGGYYNLIDYIESIRTESMIVDGKKVPWKPFHEAIYYTLENLKSRKAKGLVNFFNSRETNKEDLLKTLSPDEKKLLLDLSPSTKLSNFKAPIYIIHSKQDDRVPYVESLKLYNALPANYPKEILITDIFRHVKPDKNFDFYAPQAFPELVKFYSFFYQILYSL